MSSMRLVRAAAAALPATLLLGTAAQSAPAVTVQRDGSVQIAGRTLKCGSVRHRLDSGLQNLGISIPDRRLIVINPAWLGREQETVRLFVYAHECAHHAVGGSELAADCRAARRGVREGWLDRTGLGQVCRSFRNAPETATHPSGARRCSNLERCFATESALLARDRQRAEAAASAAADPAPATPPGLVSGPTLVRDGRVRPAAAPAFTGSAPARP
jgi:hypothetical protein